MGDDPVLSLCSLLINPRPKPICVLEDCSEVETNCWFSVFGVFFSRISKVTKDDNVAIPLYFTSEFRSFIIFILRTFINWFHG
jgi:hypothetical protein